MSNSLCAILAALAAYMVGSLPFGYLIAKFRAGIDIRDHGSGNIGATNVARVLGVRWGIGVMVLDGLKGLLPTLLVPQLFFATTNPWFPHVRVLCGVATVIGHMFPVYLRFRGGKGVATSLGVITVLSPWATLVAFVSYLVAFAAFRIGSVASLSGALAFVIAHFVRTPSPFSLSEWSLTTFAMLVPLLIFVRHRSNIGRILRGEEPRFQFGRSRSEQPATDRFRSAVEGQRRQESGKDNPNRDQDQDRETV